MHFGQDAVSRVIQGIMTGLGFLGAGAILRERNEMQVHGLTTAATVWIAAGLGVTAGLGAWFITIAGTLVNVGRGYWPEEQVATILEAGDRRRAGPTAPARGLFLMRVTYDR